MNHSINTLTDEGLRFLNDRLTDIRVCLEDLRLEPQRGEAPVMERCERILPTELFNELRAYLGSIEQHHAVICDVLYGEGGDLEADGLVVGEMQPLDECSPHGIERPSEALVAACAPVADDAITRYIAQAERGLITHTEAMALIDNYWDQRGMYEASDLDKTDWMYDHDVLDAQQYHEALIEVWVNHDVATCDGGFDGCQFCSTSTPEGWKDAYLVKRFPQMTGAPSVCEPGTPG